jgi:hypothetical protein
MPAPRIVYARSKQDQLAGLPMKPSGPISDPDWIALLRDTAQYAPEVEAEGLGGFGKRFRGAVRSVTHPIAASIHAVQVMQIQAIQAAQAAAVKPIAAVAPVITRPVVAIRSTASSVLSPIASAGKVAVGVSRGLVGKVIPGVAPKPSRPSADEAAYNNYINTEVQVNPYNHQPISATEYQQWLDASTNNWWVPVGWHQGQPALTQAQIDASASPSYPDGYRPAESQSEFDAYVATVNAANAAPVQPPTMPTTIAETSPAVGSTRIGPGFRFQRWDGSSWVDAPELAPTSSTQIYVKTPQPVTINQAAALTTTTPVVLDTPAAPTLQPPSAEPLTIAAAASTSGTQTDPPAQSKAPIGLIATVGAAAFFLLKK